MDIDLSSSTAICLTLWYAGSIIWEPWICINEPKSSITNSNCMPQKCFILHREITSLKLDLRYECWSEQLNCDMPDHLLCRFNHIGALDMHKWAKIKHNNSNCMPHTCFILHRKLTSLKLGLRYEYWSKQLNCDMPDLLICSFDHLWA